MGLFQRLFGTKATDHQRAARKLVRMLLRDRLAKSAEAQLVGVTPAYVDSLPDEALLGTPEDSIVTMVEGFTRLRRNGFDHREAILAIESHRSKLMGTIEMPSPLTFRRYVRSRITHEYAATAPVSDEALNAAVDAAFELYG